MAISDIVNRLRNIAEQMKMGIYSPGHIAVVKEAEALLSAARWIPCSEKLPDLNTPVQVTYIGANDGKPYADLPAYRNAEGKWYWCLGDDPPTGWKCTSLITHWRPLPPPAEK